MSYRCEHCGAFLKIIDGATSVTCEYCNTTFSIQALREVNSYDESATVSLEKMLIRGEILLEDEEFSKAEELYDKILVLEPTCARAYIGQIQATYEIKYEKDLFKLYVGISELAQFHRATQFATPQYLAKLEEYRLEAGYEDANIADDEATTPEEALSTSTLFENLGNFKDAPQRAIACREKAQALLTQRERVEKENERMIEKRSKKRFNLVLFFLASLIIYFVFLRLPLAKIKINSLIDQGSYQQALEAVKSMNQPEKFAPLLLRIAELQYKAAEEFEEKGFYTRAWSLYMEAQSYGDARVRAARLRTLSKPSTKTVATVMALQGDGTLYLRCSLSDWENSQEKKVLESWSDLVYFTTDGDHTVAIQSDGTILQYNNLKKVSSSGTLNQAMGNDLIAIEEFKMGYVGLKRDGTLVFSEFHNVPSYATAWKNIATIQSSGSEITAVTHDGRVLSTTDDEEIQKEISQWSDIVAAAMDYRYMVGLRSDGTVVFAGNAYTLPENTEIFTDGSMISVDGEKVYLLKQDGALWQVDLSSRSYGDRAKQIDSECVALSPINGNVYWSCVKENGTIIPKLR